MQQRGAGAPMAKNKYGRLLNPRFLNFVAEQRLLKETQDRVAAADAGNNSRDVPIGGLHIKAVPPEQPKPSWKIAAFPKSRRPFSAPVFQLTLNCHVPYRFNKGSTFWNRAIVRYDATSEKTIPAAQQLNYETFAALSICQLAF